MEALAVEGASGIITSALWLQLCKSRLRLQKPEAAEEACGTAQRRLPDDEDALVQKVWQSPELIKAADHCRAQSSVSFASEQQRSDDLKIENEPSLLSSLFVEYLVS